MRTATVWMMMALLFGLFVPATACNAQTAPIGKWVMVDIVDEMTEVAGFKVTQVAVAESRGRKGEFEVEVTCDDQTANPGESKFSVTVRYFSDFDKSMGYESNSLGILYVRESIDGKLETRVVNLNYDNETTIRYVPYATLADAQLLKLEFPLANGDRPILTIRPQDAVFKNFVTRCKTAFPEG